MEFVRNGGGRYTHFPLIFVVVKNRPKNSVLGTKNSVLLCGNTDTDSLALAFVHGAALLSQLARQTLVDVELWIPGSHLKPN